VTRLSICLSLGETMTGRGSARCVFGTIWMISLWSAVKIEDAMQANVRNVDVEKVWR
jgi:hypothetical protein